MGPGAGTKVVMVCCQMMRCEQFRMPMVPMVVLCVSIESSLCHKSSLCRITSQVQRINTCGTRVCEFQRTPRLNLLLSRYFLLLFPHSHRKLQWANRRTCKPAAAPRCPPSGYRSGQAPVDYALLGARASHQTSQCVGHGCSKNGPQRRKKRM